MDRKCDWRVSVEAKSRLAEHADVVYGTLSHSNLSALHVEFIWQSAAEA